MKTDTAKLIEATYFAADKHRDQRRRDKGATPYINHPISLTHILVDEGGIEDTDVLCAALLHDTIEDTDTTAEELAVHFGDRITAIVLEVTDDTSQHFTVRKQAQIDHAPHMSREAKLVKLADKISNVRDLLAFPPHDWPIARKQAYMDFCAAVVNGLRGTNAGLEAAFDALVARRVELA
ncbi:HD domain-containing protein [Asticcacaulis solisilvae]|uniref:HD domain-containing protein n=1 Tax=Asticcacaulis solisilvae TaxID=1217274 RepID=UPI003FD81177